MVPYREHGVRFTYLRTDHALRQALDWASLGMDHGEYRHGSHHCVSREPRCQTRVIDFCSVSLILLYSAISAYALEKYPEQATCVSAILNMWRTCGGFAVGYFQPAWIQRNGLGLVFGIQAAIVCVAIVLTITPVLLWEQKKRSRTDNDANADD